MHVKFSAYRVHAGHDPLQCEDEGLLRSTCHLAQRRAGSWRQGEHCERECVLIGIRVVNSAVSSLVLSLVRGRGALACLIGAA